MENWIRGWWIISRVKVLEVEHGSFHHVLRIPLTPETLVKPCGQIQAVKKQIYNLYWLFLNHFKFIKFSF